MWSIKRILGLQDPVEPLYKDGKNDQPDPTVLEWAEDSLPSTRDLINYLSGLFPFWQWIGHYNLTWFWSDLIAGTKTNMPRKHVTTSLSWAPLTLLKGITVGAVVVPESMGYAKLAGVPTQYGLYTSFTGGVIYWLFATSKDITIGVREFR